MSILLIAEHNNKEVKAFTLNAATAASQIDADVHAVIIGQNCGDAAKALSELEIIKKVIPFAQKHLENEGRLWQISKHIINLIENIPNAKILRQELSEKSQTQKANISILKKIAQQLEDAGH